MLKHYFLLLLIAGISVTGFAQSADEVAIRKTFDAYFKVLQTKDNDATLDYMYPKMFELVPRQSLVEMMDAMYADTTRVMGYASPKLYTVSEVLKEGSGKYALISYSFNLLMEIKPGEDTTGLAEQNARILGLLRGQYGEKRVALEESKNLFTITPLSTMFAISEPGFTGWKFMENKKGGEAFLEKLLPKKVIKKFM